MKNKKKNDTNKNDSRGKVFRTNMHMNTNKRIGFIAAAILLLAVVGVATTYLLFPYDPLKPPEAYDEGSTIEGMEELVNANNKFSFDMLYKMNGDALNEMGRENVFYSPYSIFSALAITYEGARGDTAQEMKGVFYFPESDVLRPNYAAIYNMINAENKSYELRTGNALWVQEDFRLLDEYTGDVEKYYGGKAANLDFSGDTEEARNTINSFIEQQTNNRIEDLIPEGVLSRDTKLVLTNAIYFKGSWKYEFDPDKTVEEDFWISEEESVKADMMHMSPDEARFNYFENDEVQMIELPYEDDELSMIIMLPKERLEDVGHLLNNEDFCDLKSQMQETKIDSIYLPRFKFETKYMMKNQLADMGMPLAFTDAADFSGMTGGRDLMIADVIHQAFVEVNEEGTEAAAATGVVMMPTSAGPVDKTIFRADKPFVFIIQENETGSILFKGQVNDPSQ